MIDSKWKTAKLFCIIQVPTPVAKTLDNWNNFVKQTPRYHMLTWQKDENLPEMYTAHTDTHAVPHKNPQLHVDSKINANSWQDKHFMFNKCIKSHRVLVCWGCVDYVSMECLISIPHTLVCLLTPRSFIPKQKIPVYQSSPASIPFGSTLHYSQTTTKHIIYPEVL